MDKLEHIFYLQFKLQKKLGVIKQIKNDSDKQQFINLNILAIFEEAVEIIKESAYKNPKVIKFGWKKGQFFNEENFKAEIIDLFHFLVNLCLVVNMDADEFYNRYCIKNIKNINRKNEGY